MIFVDTDILSVFAKIQRLPLLFSVFNQDSLNIATAVENEIKTGVSKGFQFSRDILTLHSKGRIQIHHPTVADQQFMATLTQTLGAGERESMAICKRLTATFASNERRVMHHCLANGIHCISLAEILRALWELRILTQSDVRKAITEIETQDNLQFRTIDPIFKGT